VKLPCEDFRDLLLFYFVFLTFLSFTQPLTARAKDHLKSRSVSFHTIIIFVVSGENAGEINKILVAACDVD
jgi:hypothetical protein